jgi:hypothetical protein
MRKFCAIWLALKVPMFSYFAVLFIVWISATPAAAQSSYIYIHEGGNGEISISTPWGDYAAYDEGGGYFWVGTQREFDRERVIGLAQQSGMRLSTVNVSGADATFVGAGTYRTYAAGVPIDNVSVDIMFGLDPHKGPHRPEIPSSDRYIAISWLQSTAQPTASVFLVNRRTGRVLRPYYAGEDRANANYETEFAVPRADLSRPYLLLFVVRGGKPGAIGVRSLAYADYRGEIGTVDELRSAGVAPDKDALQQITELEAVDPGIQASHRDAPPHKASAQMPSAQTAHPTSGTTVASVQRPPAEPATYAYTGQIQDNKLGDGALSLTFTFDAQNKVSGGSWTATYQNGTSTGGTIRWTGPGLPARVFFYFQSSGCEYQAHATVHADGSLSNGVYAGLECAGTGTFALKGPPAPFPLVDSPLP